MVSAGSSNLAASSAGWRANLADAAMEVFAMMVGPGISGASGKSAPALPNVTGMVGIAGALRSFYAAL